MKQYIYVASVDGSLMVAADTKEKLRADFIATIIARHPETDREELESNFNDQVVIERVLWLP